MSEKIQTQKLSNLIFTFAGLTLSVTAFLVGSNVGMSLSLSKGIMAIVFGNIILAVYSGLIGVIGSKTKESSTMISRPVFGTHGQIITSSIVVVFLMGFVSVYSSMIGNLINTLFPFIPAYVGNLIFVVCICATTITGFAGMSKLSKVGVPLLGVFVSYGLFQINKNMSLSSVFSVVPTSTLAFGLIISQVVSVWTAAATFSSDMTRFAKSPKHVFITTFTAFGLTSVLEMIGLVLSLGTGKGDLVAILSSLNMVVPALFIYLLLMWTSGQSLLYSFSLAFDNISKIAIKNKKGFPLSLWVGIGSAIAFIGSIIMTAYGLTASFNTFLLTIGIAIPPIGGILISHYYIINKNMDNAFENMPSIRPYAFIAWICGILIAKYIGFGIPALNGMISAFLIYAVLGLVLAREERQVAE